MTLLGLDIGTTSCKACIFDEQGSLLSKASREYPVDIPRPRWAEHDIENIWQLAQEAMWAAIQDSGMSEIAALALSVHGEAVTPVDEQGNALRPTILGMDTRTDKENDWLRERLGAEQLFNLTGMPIHTINTLPKLLWIKHHEPEIWSRAAEFLLVEDFLIKKMTGKAVISACLASRTQMFELAKGRWADEILDVLGMRASRLAEVLPSGTAAGRMMLDLSTSLGLRNRPLIVTGGHDQACGALGVGLTLPGLAMVSTGTAEVVEVALPSPKINKELFNSNISIYHHVVPSLFLAMTLNHSGGMALRWFRNNFCELEMEQAAQKNSDVYDLILSGVPVGPTNIMLLPHFSGSGTPTFDGNSKAAILGLTFGTTKKEVAKAILEGVTFELQNNLELLRAGGIKIDELRAIGGGAKSPLWLQLKADITGIPVAVPRVTEASGLGAAVLAGVGAGLFQDASHASEQLLQFIRRYEPDPSLYRAYKERYEIFCEIYPALKDINYRL